MKGLQDVVTFLGEGGTLPEVVRMRRNEAVNRESGGGEDMTNLSDEELRAIAGQ